MSFYHATELEGQHLLFLERPRVGSLKDARHTTRGAARYVRQQPFHIGSCLTIAVEGSALEKCAHALSMADPRSLGVLE
jgi:hypothetical protein